MAKVYVCISKLFEHIKCKSCSDIILKKQISAIITSLGETLAYLGIKANKNAKSHKKTVNQYQCCKNSLSIDLKWQRHSSKSLTESKKDLKVNSK